MTTPDPTTRDAADVCSLSPDALEERRATIRREIAPHVTRTETLANGLAFEFPASPGMRAKLEQFVAFERQCCAGLAFDLAAAPGADALRLSVEGAGAEVFAALGAGAAAPAPGAGKSGCGC